MGGLEEGYVEPVVNDNGAGANANAAATTSATTSSTEETPEALAARQANERSSAAAEDEATRIANSQRESQSAANAAATNNSLFDKSTELPAGKVIEIADTDLVMIDGQLVPYGQVKASTVFKPRYDQAVRERDALAAQQGAVAQREQKIAGAEPYVKVLENDTYIRIYTNAKVMGRTDDEAHAAAAAATGRTPATLPAQAAAIDPRLIPPVDEQGEALPDDDPRYLKWQAGPFTAATAEAATRKVLAEAQAEVDRKAQAERDRATERDRIAQQANAGTAAIKAENERVFQLIAPEMIAHGIRVDTMTPQERTRTFNIFADTAKFYNKDVRSEKYTTENVFQVGDIRSILDSKVFADKMKPVSDKGPATAGEVVNANGQAAGANGAAVGTNGQATNGRTPIADAQGNLVMQNNYAKQPLNAGSPSEAIPGQNVGLAQQGDPEEMTAQAMDALG